MHFISFFEMSLKNSILEDHKCYKGHSIRNQPDLFLTVRHSHDFHSVFGHHIRHLYKINV